MGQKTNPIGNRLGIIRGWDSSWYGSKKTYAPNLLEDTKINNETITAIMASYNPSGTVYYGTVHGKLFKMENLRLTLNSSPHFLRVPLEAFWRVTESQKNKYQFKRQTDIY